MPITFTATIAPDEDDPALVVTGVRSDRLAEDVEPRHQARAALSGFGGQLGQHWYVEDEDGTPQLQVGLGPAAAVDALVLRRAAATAARRSRRSPRLALDLLGLAAAGSDGAVGAQALVEGVLAGSYRYDRFRSDVDAGTGASDGTEAGPRPDRRQPSRLESVVIVGRGGKRLVTGIERGEAIGAAVTLARDLVNEPGGSLTPPVFADRATEAAAAAGLRISVLDEDGIRAARMGGLLGVNRGSFQPPRFVEIAWEPEKPRGFVALVGKGITFDSGGLSIKTNDGMSTMKCDMGGAAAALAALTAVPKLAPRLRVAAYLPLTDNMLGPDATRVGDVLTMRNGVTVEVMNTDAEGRLVLADALVKASEDGPDAILDLATLTGACEVALGLKTAGLMGTHDGLRDMVVAAGAATGEDVWPLPMPAHLRRQLDSEVAELRNVGTSRFGGALVAAHFLARFVGDGIPWAHLDIAGPAWSFEDDVEVGRGGTGFGVRLLLELLAHWRRPPG